MVGNKEEISLIAKNIGMDLNKFEIVNIEEPKKATLHAVNSIDRKSRYAYEGSSRYSNVFKKRIK